VIKGLFVAIFVSLVALAERPPVNDGAAHGDPPYLLEDGWTPLLNGNNLDGWMAQDPQKGAWTPTRGVFWDAAAPRGLLGGPGVGDRIVNGPKGGVTNLVTAAKFGDLELYVEFLIPARSNSGVYLHGLYEIQVFDSFGVVELQYLDCGAVYQRWNDGKGFGGMPPRVNASRRAGEWQSFHIWFQGPRFDAAGRKTANAKFVRVLHNGVLIHENVEVDGPTRSAMDIPEAATNPLMLQGDHGPVAYRNIYVRPLRALAGR
jgi:hypothetical protein